MKPFAFVVSALTLLTAFTSPAQNLYEEVIPYTLSHGKIVIPVSVSGKTYRFALDLGGRSSTAILSEHSGEQGVLPNNVPVTYPRADIRAISGGSLEKVGVGENIFLEKTGVFILDDDTLRSWGVDGIAGTELFSGRVLTIDSREQTITVSYPYKPAYVHLRNRTDMPDSNVMVVSVGGKDIQAALDLWQNETLALSEADNTLLGGGPEYTIRLATTDIGTHLATVGQRTLVGAPILNYGVLTFDYTKGKVYFEPWATLEKPEAVTRPEAPRTEGNIIHLDRKLFQEKVFNFRSGGHWRYLGEKPAVIDFWAEWCGPCKQLEPVIKTLSDELQGEVIFYKLNIDQQKEIADYFGVQAIPLLMFIPMDGEPIRNLGVTGIEEVRKIIKDNF